MSRRKGLHVVLMLALALALLPIGAAAQDLVAQADAAPPSDKPGAGLPDGKQPPDERPALPLDLPAGSEAVATGYGWSQTTGSYTEITGGTVHGSASNDDASFNAVELGFTFTYDGAAFTQVSIQSNGFIAMGVTVTNSYSPLSSGSTNRVVSALGRDLQGNGTTSELMSLMEGTAPNRVFTVQWKHYKRYGSTYVGDDFNFQIKLYETSNEIEVVYGPFTVVSVTSPPTVQVGLRGADNTDFNNRTSTGDWTTSAAGATNAANMALTEVHYPPSGLTWAWAPLLAPANIFVDPLSLGASQPPNTTTGQPLTIANTGDQDLSWAILEAPASTLEHPLNVVLWDQPANGTSGIVSDFFIGSSAGAYSASDFELSDAASIGLIYAAGFDTTNTLASQPAINWAIYADAAGVPAGHPEDGSGMASALWFYSSAVDGPGVDITDNNITLDLVAAGQEQSLPPGTYWLTVYPSYDVTGAGGARWNWYQAAQVGAQTHLVSPVIFGVASWTPLGSLGVTFTDTAFRLEDSQAGVCDDPADVPWLSAAPTAGTTAGGASATVDVLYDSTGLADGVYTANLCIESNDPDTGPGNETELVIVPVTLTVQTTAAPAISLVKTVGTEPAVCATTTSITVAPGTTVYYCYEVTNTGDVTLNLHDLVDDQLGTIFSGFSYALTPGSSIDTVAAGLSIPSVITAPITNLGTWTAYNSGPVDQAVATATATVNVADPDITVDPTSLLSTLMSNQTTTLPLTLGNVGGSDLVWNILEEPAIATPPVSQPPAELPVFVADVEAELSGVESATPTPAVRDPAAAARARLMLQVTGLLLVPDSTNDRVMAFDPITGNLVDADFIPSNSVMGTAINAILSAGGDSILVSDQTGDVVHEFDLDGNYLGVFAPAGGANTSILDNIRGISLRPNGNLLVTVGGGANANAVAEFDTAGVYLGNFVANGSGGLDSPFDVFGRTADWLVAGINSDAIHRYDLTGAYLDNLTSVNSFPEQINEASNGNVLVANFSPSANEGVIEYTSTGTFVGRYDPAGLGGYRGVYELPDGTILTTTGAGVHQIDRLGNLVESKITGVSGRFIEFVAPMVSCDNPADVPWLSSNPTAGTIAPSGSQVVDVTFDSTGIALGTYQATICVFSNDPDEPVVPVPVTMDVVIPVELQSFSVE